MNIVFSVVRNSEFVKNKKYKSFFDSLENLNSNTNVIVINSTSEELDKKITKNHQVINNAPMGSDLNLYGSISGLLSQIKPNNDDLILLVDIENIVFTRDPFSYIQHFDKDLYFYSMNHISNESEKVKTEYIDFVKTCNFYMGNDFDSYSIGTHIFGGKCFAFKSILFSLFLNVNRNSANLLTSGAVLSYTHKHINNLYNVGMLTNQFCKVVTNQNMAESIYGNLDESKKQYAVIIA